MPANRGTREGRKDNRATEAMAITVLVALWLTGWCRPKVLPAWHGAARVAGAVRWHTIGLLRYRGADGQTVRNKVRRIRRRWGTRLLTCIGRPRKATKKKRAKQRESAERVKRKGQRGLKAKEAPSRREPRCKEGTRERTAGSSRGRDEVRKVTKGSARWVWQLIVMGILTWQKVFRGWERERRYNESRLSTDNSKRTSVQERRQGVAISAEEIMEYYGYNGSQGGGNFGPLKW